MMAPVVEPVLEAVAAALERGDSLEAFRASLPALFAELDDTRLAEALRRMGFSAAVSGAAGLGEGTDNA